MRNTTFIRLTWCPNSGHLCVACGIVVDRVFMSNDCELIEIWTKIILWVRSCEIQVFGNMIYDSKMGSDSFGSLYLDHMLMKFEQNRMVFPLSLFDKENGLPLYGGWRQFRERFCNWYLMLKYQCSPNQDKSCTKHGKPYSFPLNKVFIIVIILPYLVIWSNTSFIVYLYTCCYLICFICK